MPLEVRTDLGKALLVKRFDRDAGRRIHTEDFNQVFSQHPDDKYKNVSYGNMLSNIWRTMRDDTTTEFVRRLVFSIGVGNADMHLKNWSLIYKDGKTPTLAPAYDYVSTVVYIENDKLGLTLARTREWADIDEDRLERFARRSGVPRGLVLKPAREMVERMMEAWRNGSGDWELTREARSKINRHMQSIPIFGGSAVKGQRLTVTDEPREIA